MRKRNSVKTRTPAPNPIQSKRLSTRCPVSGSSIVLRSTTVQYLVVNENELSPIGSNTAAMNLFSMSLMRECDTPQHARKAIMATYA